MRRSGASFGSHTSPFLLPSTLNPTSFTCTFNSSRALSLNKGSVSSPAPFISWQSLCALSNRGTASHLVPHAVFTMYVDRLARHLPDGRAVMSPSFYPDPGPPGWYPELQQPRRARLEVRPAIRSDHQVYVQPNALLLSSIPALHTEAHIQDLLKPLDHKVNRVVYSRLVRVFAHTVSGATDPGSAASAQTK